MQFSTALELLRGVPFLEPERAKLLYDFVRQEQPQNVLELGFAHGTSTCYIAAALDENRSGSITSVDNHSARDRSPSIDELLARTKLSNYVECVYANRSYTWELMKTIERQTRDGQCQPLYDFCFIDGAHSWEVDGLAFLLVEKLLKPGGWVLFDDVDWTYGGSPALRDTEFVRDMAADERSTPQVERVVTLLAAQHPHVETVQIKDGWAWVKKRSDQLRAKPGRTIDQVYSHRPLREKLVSALRGILRPIRPGTS
jgi:predicted O-methyltransferase YrrM